MQLRILTVNDVLPCLRVTFYYVILEKHSYTREDTRLHTLISYVLLVVQIHVACDMCMDPIYILNGTHSNVSLSPNLH